MRDGNFDGHGSGKGSGEPLVRLSDLAEYRAGLARHLGGEWDDERWTAFRVRFGVYGQKQPGVQMVRIKIPGGVMPRAWLKTIARVNRDFAVGDAHFTTRQDVQIYHVPLARSAELLESLYGEGVTTREACGNTLRNMNSCALAGACPRELVDAGKVAQQLATSWIRHPLVQHMPRKVKIGVSGCATDCGATAIHDLGFIATERDGAKGFKVMAGGGLGSQPIAAVEVLPFVTEDQLPTVVEALARIHQRYSDRRNRNAARIKFVNKRFGGDKFAGLLREEFDRLKDLPQRPFAPLQWRDAAEAAVPRTPVGVLPAHDGSSIVVVYVPLGIVSSDQLDALHDIAAAAGVAELRVTRDQNIAFLGVAAGKLDALVAAVKAIGLDVPATADDVPDVVSCPGTTTCRIGITNSQSFGRQVEAEARGDATARGVSVHVSGCQNSCGLHHVADIGLHGMAKKIDGRSAPHYQVHLGGNAYTGEIAVEGPLVAARLADQAVKLLRQGFAAGKLPGEGVRDWAVRLGKDGLAALLAPIQGQDADGVFVDWGDTADFAGAPKARGECAAPFAADELLADLADDALITLDRALLSGRDEQAAGAAREAALYASRRLLALRGEATDDEQPADAVHMAVACAYGDRPEVLEALAAARSGEREAVAVYIDTVREVAGKPAAATAAVGDLASILAGVAE